MHKIFNYADYNAINQFFKAKLSRKILIHFFCIFLAIILMSCKMQMNHDK
jgi:hypothetical protein